MKYGRQYKIVIYLALLLVAMGGCTKELPADTDSPGENKTTRIIFNSSNFTKADLQTPTDGNEDGINTIDLFGFLWGHDQNNGTLKIMNFFHKRVMGKDTIVVESSYFEKSLRGEKGKYTNLYAIANRDFANVNQIGSYASWDKYIAAMRGKTNSVVAGNQAFQLEDEALLNDLISQPAFDNFKWDHPIMAKKIKVEGGASTISMPLERLHCRIGFSFVLTGNSSDKITIDTIRIKKVNIKGYLFKEENLTPPYGDRFTWGYKPSSVKFMRDASGAFHSQPLSPGQSKLTMCNNENGALFYLYSFQYICDNEAEASTIEIWVTSESGGDQPHTRTLTAPLYNTSGTGTKKHYGLLRNHSYEVISTINSTTLELENVTVETSDWIDRGNTDIPEFQ